MSDWITSVAATGIRAAIAAAERTIRTIRESAPPNGRMTIDTDQAEELSRFLAAYVTELKKRLTAATRAPQQGGSWTAAIRRQSELESAIEFINAAFVSPRIYGDFAQILEAADWLCMEVWQHFCKGLDAPLGPLVAVDSRRSPAVWAADTALPLPSLFSPLPSTFARTEHPADDDRILRWFPVVCLPTALTRLPEFFPLLSHEVGHAVDDVRRISKQALQQLEGNPHHQYWAAWMREIVADFIGVAASGHSFALALKAYARFMNVPQSITWSSAYPPHVAPAGVHRRHN